MIRDAERTRKRLLEAATAEFAEVGIAGARVNRIAEVAGCNKAMLYAYYGSKDLLFDAVFTAHVAEFLERVPFDARDLPAYAGRLHDHFEENPAAQRLAVWYRLERPGSAHLDAVVDINRTRLDEVARAQADGVLADHYPPAALLALVQAVSTSWSSMNPEFEVFAPADRERRRAAVVDAVRRLTAP
ncbi:TetR family transcriptional regulator [Umezawaea endophytica]|uniref:TetR family transcriptional regulator n=1 Tax=Umezawaea endophytica TaxID=1654476 RepID=A0A9X2VY18_9PSEU|nr:TetR family transcriptional regulator [Umezawaea endophytica]MCS7484774.1 TetR family transcriptional regulator [Umezawaea endophytica]